MLKIISPDLLNGLTQKANQSPRRRLNHNFHEELADPINRMLNALEPGTYIQPHKHENPDKREVFIVLRGSLVVVFFDDSGNPNEFVLLDPENGNYGVEVPVGAWHSLFALEAGTVIYEVKDGPYSPLDDKNFASWAPREGEPECEAYLKMMIDRYNNR